MAWTLGRTFARLALVSATACQGPAAPAAAPAPPTQTAGRAPPACPAASAAPVVTADSGAPPVLASVEFSPRSVQCAAYGQPIGTSLQRNDDGTSYRGGATDNYEAADFSSCSSAAPSTLTCSGTWRFSKTPAQLTIVLRSDGSVLGTLTRPQGGVVPVSCMASGSPIAR